MIDFGEFDKSVEDRLKKIVSSSKREVISGAIDNTVIRIMVAAIAKEMKELDMVALVIDKESDHYEITQRVAKELDCIRNYIEREHFKKNKPFDFNKRLTQMAHHGDNDVSLSAIRTMIEHGFNSKMPSLNPDYFMPNTKPAYDPSLLAGPGIANNPNGTIK